MARNIVQVKRLQAASKSLGVRRNGKPNVLEMQSGSDPSKVYEVLVLGSGELLCDCPWSQWGGSNCKHVLAAHRFIAGIAGRRVSFWLDPEDAKRQKAKTIEVEGLYITSRRGA